ncbi:cell division protein FtsW [Rhodoblastus acidophilus]|uniref:Probable peptidoglycan glycosyltransferase FtsW n=1 Tax=Rhodoblastus acidophilus TaxID=1074 RepID=A0A6N8DKF3_RHOAC|nr:putative peptidoglycan glycosyltransferase FtsW [Rhodoblastus acidophilus]MCW2273580.1 cell division protein FtsW [Rhodoblastus acidophilus]MTV30336.1 cell division protein FtsW [Rhodoblastus acidophilus]
MVSRAERSPVADWWWTVDRWLLAAVGALIVCGLVLIMAGSPPVAERIGLPTFHFVNRQVELLAPSVAFMIACSFLTPRQLRRGALVLYIVAMAGIFAALLFGHEVKGAKRWIFGVQPSEFLKPAFVILAAWAFSEGARRRDVPGNLLAIALLPVTIIPLVLQPDFGQTLLICLVWGALLVMAGLHWLWFPALGGVGVVGAGLAYKFAPHVRARIQNFLNPGEGGGQADTFQVETAHDAFVSGGWFGKGPGEGTFKQILPDSHTDFIFAVTGEEFGLIFCMALVGLFAFIVLRSLIKASSNEDPFCRFATAGLAMLFGIQASINIAVNLHLMPAKGMTLPFISYGGSSLLSLGIGMGFLIAVTRKRPRSEILFDHRRPPEGHAA